MMPTLSFKRSLKKIFCKVSLKFLLSLVFSIILLYCVLMIVFYVRWAYHLNNESKRNGNGNSVSPFFRNHLIDMSDSYIVPDEMKDKLSKITFNNWKIFGYSIRASEYLSLYRRLPNNLHKWCYDMNNFSKDLPKVDIIITFHNDALTVIRRLLNSIYYESPAHLLGHIILIDDSSNLRYLKYHLKTYMSDFDNIKVIRSSKHQGLHHARTLGAKFATADVLLFLDAYCECSEGYLVPLLDAIVKNPKAVVAPVIHDIQPDTFRYSYNKKNQRTIYTFDWDLKIGDQYLNENDSQIINRKYLVEEPLKTAVLPNGIFAISSKYFKDLGYYDPGTNRWHYDNIELALKVWMCGGTLQIVQCSHIGRIKKSQLLNENTYSYSYRSIKYRNMDFLTEIWFDEYKDFVYKSVNELAHKKRDFTHTLRIKHILECNNFNWFMQNVIFGLSLPVPSTSKLQILRNGSLKRRLCLSVHNNGDFVIPWDCKDSIVNNNWIYTETYELRKGFKCLTVAEHKKVSFCKCSDDEHINQIWLYNYTTKQILSKSGECLTMLILMNSIEVAECNATKVNQKWEFQNINQEFSQNFSSIL